MHRLKAGLQTFCGGVRVCLLPSCWCLPFFVCRLSDVGGTFVRLLADNLCPPCDASTAFGAVKVFLQHCCRLFFRNRGRFSPNTHFILPLSAHSKMKSHPWEPTAANHKFVTPLYLSCKRGGDEFMICRTTHKPKNLSHWNLACSMTSIVRN